MKLVSLATLVLAVIAGVAIYRAQAEPRQLHEDQCIGLGCWPQSFPTKHRPAYRPSLPPLW